MKYIIYKVTCLNNGKAYIGLTKNSLNKRKSQHEYEAKRNISKLHFHRAILKEGSVNFVWIVLQECNNKSDAAQAEIKLIKEHKTFENGYNASKGGEGTEYNQSARERMIGNTYRKGVTLSEEHKAAISAAMSGRTTWNKGIKTTEATKAKISASLKETMSNKQFRTKRSQIGKAVWKKRKENTL